MKCPANAARHWHIPIPLSHQDSVTKTLPSDSFSFSFSISFLVSLLSPFRYWRYSFIFRVVPHVLKLLNSQSFLLYLSTNYTSI